jgi:uncharacterized protein (DUF2252 family)
VASVGVLPENTPQESITQRISPFVVRPTPGELRAKGKNLREKCPRNSHSTWKVGKDRPDPVELVEEANRGRLPNLIPIRHGRMVQSPFTFYRGTALNMAADLAGTPTTGVRVQACGDAHLGNFRGFATPERRVIFGINDFDETLPAPWEWDVKRLAASFVVACRNNGISDTSAREAVLNCARSYRQHMAEFSRMNVMNLWYASYEVEALVEKLGARHRKRLDKARERTAFEHDFPKLVCTAGGRPRIRDNPPTIYHWPEDQVVAWVQDAFTSYRSTLRPHVRMVLDRFELLDKAVRVVGVGSVGTVCFVLLLMASEKDPLFLQVKQARASVLEAYAGNSVLPNHGQRVVVGHWLMQSASDLFLGWTASRSGRNYYIRQLRDAKIKFQVERFDSAQMIQFAECCGYTLARAHARSGEPATISGYLGKKSDEFDKAIEAFSIAYADQAERDYESFRKAIQKGRLPSEIE